jgi:hypothetical protein
MLDSENRICDSIITNRHPDDMKHPGCWNWVEVLRPCTRNMVSRVP